jgi:hypothetical protein
MILRRKRLPAQLEPAFAAFSDVVNEIEAAKSALTDCMPTTRLPGRPLPDALIEYEAHLEAARPLMPGWRVAQTEDRWHACESALTDAIDLASRLRTEAPELGGFEGLLGTVEALMDRLAPFEAAEQRFQELKA